MSCPHRVEAPVRHLSAQLVCAALVILAFALVAVVVPREFTRLQTVCTGSSCTDPHLTASGAQSLRDIGLSPVAYAGYFVALRVTIVGAYVAVALVILVRQPRGRLALLAALFLGSFCVTTLAGPGMLREAAADHPLWRWAVTLVDIVGISSAGLFLCLFPNGRFVSTWTWILAIGWIVLLAPQYAAPTSTLNLERWPLVLQLPAWLGLFIGVAVAQIQRYLRHSDLVERQQTKWVVFGITATLATLAGIILVSAALPAAAQDGLVVSVVEQSMWSVALLGVPLGLGVAILHYRLFDIDLIINRALVYATLTACIVALYALPVAVAGMLVQARGTSLVSLAAAALVALAFAPLRSWLQRGVNRLLYGQRDEPYEILSHLGRRLEGMMASDLALDTLVETVAQELRLPYVAITLGEDERAGAAAACGTPSGQPLSLPLTDGGAVVGHFLLCPRPGQVHFAARDRCLLEDLARQAGVAVRALRLNHELQLARERLVTAREEERRRLRRDLHDDLGPQLGSQTLTLAAVRKILRSDPESAEELLDEAVGHAQQAIVNIRRVVYGLRPPALDDLGLVPALSASVERYRRQLDVTIAAPVPLPALSAAAEVAAYHIVQEALANVVKHAHARHCYVRLWIDGVLHLEIVDDGIGIPAARQPGVGLASMRERAAELGGTCRIDGQATGTAILVELPIQPFEPRQVVEERS